MKKDKVIAALDIGASKVCCLIGLPQKNDIIDILGYGICHHDCLNRGVVVDIGGLSDVISIAVSEAEENSNEKINSIFFNISGSHIKGLSSHGEVVISDRDNEITKRDTERLLAGAKALHMPYERDVIYTARKDFVVDGERGIVNPVGMFGLKLETDLYLVTAKIAILDNIKKAVRQAGLAIDNYAISGIATGACVLTRHDKDLGAVLIDIGADLTEILIFLDGQLSYLSVIPKGGDDITDSIAEKLCIPAGSAERLKIENGFIDDSRNRDEKIVIKADSRKKTVSSTDLNKIILGEYNVIFDAVKKELDKSGYAKDASSGIVICGEPAMMDGCLELAELKLNLPVRMGHIVGLGSSPKPLPSHIYATCAGLLKLAQQAKQSKISLLSMGPKNLFMGLVEKAKMLYSDYF